MVMLLLRDLAILVGFVVGGAAAGHLVCWAIIRRQDRS